ncbi:hypothetical protein BLSTO_06577 [Blastocystis sp. subtype 1]
MHSSISFSLRHEAVSLMGVDTNWHNPETDAIYSMKLYLLWGLEQVMRRSFRKSSKTDLQMIRIFLLQQPRVPSFHQQMAKIEGVDMKKSGPCKVSVLCLGNEQNCRERFYRDNGLPNPLYD